ncbi:MAG: hypothetical protein U0T81_18370 [Saprospiraceae bacterium]
MTSTSSVLNGRFSDCMVEVEVHANVSAYSDCATEYRGELQLRFDVTKLSNPNDATFGKVVTDLT